MPAQEKSALTNRQKETLNFIYESLLDSGFPPTLVDLKEKLSVTSNQAVLDLLKLLEEKGFIRKEEGVARGIKILEKGFNALERKPIIPYMGISSAGLYTEVFEDVKWEEAGENVELMLDTLIRIKGDSMVGAGINDGDLVIVRRAREFKNRDIVLARYEDGTTVKRFIHDNGKVYLKPENPNYKNIPIYPETRLLGKVVSILGKVWVNG